MSRRLWIAVERHAVSRDMIGHAADVLGLSRVHALGHMVAMWGEVAEDAKDGDVRDVRDSTIEHWAHWHGEPGAFAAFVKDHCLTNGRISGWDEMQGRFEREKKADAERKAASRKRPQDVRRMSAGRPRKSTVTIQDNTIQNTTTALPKVVEDPRIEEVIAHYTTHHPKRRPGQKERRMVWRALTELGYSVEELKEAIDGNAHSAYHVENNYQALELILRDNGKVDQFRLMPKPKPLYDADKYGPPVVDGVASDHLQWLTDPAHPERMVRRA